MDSELLVRELTNYGLNFIFFCELLLVLVVGRLIMKRFTGYSLDEQLTDADNPAVALSFAGYPIALLIAMLGVLSGNASEPATVFGIELSPMVIDMLAVPIWGLCAIAALNVSRIITDRVLLRGFGNLEELVRDRNIGVGACEACGYISFGLLIRASIEGHGAWWLAPIYFVTGVALLLVGALILEKLVFRRYALNEQIEQDNHAAGVLYGLHILAIGYLIHAALRKVNVDALSRDQGFSGEVFAALGSELAQVSLYMLVGVIALSLLSVLADRLMLPSASLRDEVVDDRNVGAAFIAGSIAVTGSILVMSIF